MEPMKIMATVRHSLYQKTKHSQNDIWKSLFLQTFVNIVLAALFIIVSKAEVSGRAYRISRCVGIFFMSEHSVSPETLV